MINNTAITTEDSSNPFSIDFLFTHNQLLLRLLLYPLVLPSLEHHIEGILCMVYSFDLLLLLIIIAMKIISGVVCSNSFFFRWVIFHCVRIPKIICSFYYRWIFELVPILGLLLTVICGLFKYVSIGTHYYWVYSISRSRISESLQKV